MAPLARSAAAATAVAAVALGLVAARATAGSPTAGSASIHDWNATLNYVTVRARGFTLVSRLRLRVTKNGIVVYNRPIPLPADCADGGCALTSFGLRDLGNPAGPAAVIWLWTGGAHCCVVVRVVSLPDGHMAAKNFGDPGARIVSLGGSPVFLSADDRFAYLFTSFASSRFPVRLWRFRGGRFEDVTRTFPARVEADAASYWKAVVQQRRRRGEERGVFAAWAADTCALGRRAAVERELTAAIARGEFSPPRGEDGGAVGAAYGAELRRRLRAWGYCR